MKIQIFFSGAADNSNQSLEEIINDWFSDHPDIKIKFIVQSECEKDLTISIFYIEDVMKGGQED